MTDTLTFWVVLFFLGLTVLVWPQVMAEKMTQPPTLEQRRNAVVSAIHQVESGGALRAPRGAAGEIGPLQIMESYWIDSYQEGSWEKCESLQYSTRVFHAYMSRWADEAWDALEDLQDVERVARIHNGGPRGYSKKVTEKYWERVRNALRKQGTERYFVRATSTDQ